MQVEKILKIYTVAIDNKAVLDTISPFIYVSLKIS